ncbi:MAG: hydrogenase maturation nickel metallochaperone HypA [Acidobacteria bacterium]|nr:hydrogenase maturation nickel metallochaperone HypA [Acidobacteriota bacterium]
MHELSLMEGVLAIIEAEQRRSGFARVTRVVLEVGELSGALPEALEFCFSAVVQGSVAEAATLDLQMEPARAECCGCGREVTLRSRVDLCPDCGGFPGPPRSGLDLRVKSLEVEG